jgi:hypothetical protein
LIRLRRFLQPFLHLGRAAANFEGHYEPRIPYLNNPMLEVAVLWLSSGNSKSSFAQSCALLHTFCYEVNELLRNIGCTVDFAKE